MELVDVALNLCPRFESQAYIPETGIAVRKRKSICFWEERGIRHRVSNSFVHVMEHSGLVVVPILVQRNTPPDGCARIRKYRWDRGKLVSILFSELEFRLAAALTSDLLGYCVFCQVDPRPLEF